MGAKAGLPCCLVAALIGTQTLGPPPGWAGISGADYSAERTQSAVAVPTPGEELARLGLSLFGKDYAGIDFIKGEPRLLVTRASALDVAQFGHPLKIVSHSLAELQTAHEILDREAPRLLAEGWPLQSWGVDVAANRLSISLRENSLNRGLALLNWELYDLFGSMPFVIEFSTAPFVAANGTRTSDYSPHNNGAKISGPGATCTSGFYWTSGRMATAGHCGSVGGSWTSGTNTYGSIAVNGLNISGTNRLDVAFLSLSGSGQGWMFVGSPSSDTAVHVTKYYPGIQSGVTGLRISGAMSGETSYGGGAVLGVNLTVILDPATGSRAYHMNSMECTAQIGDSGAPVFDIGSDGLYIAAGILSGFSGHVCYYTPINYISSLMGGNPAV